LHGRLAALQFDPALFGPIQSDAFRDLETACASCGGNDRRNRFGSEREERARSWSQCLHARRIAKPFPHRAGSMIVCSCNVFSDDDVRSAMAEAVAPARTAGAVYACLGCSPRCGRCARTIKQIMADAIGCADCPCTRIG
jgi:bacterioferritin-associated ferredoxin